MQQQNPVRTAIAGLSHDHVIWLLRNWQRDDLEIVGFWEPDSVLAQRYAEATAALHRAARWGTKDRPLYRAHLALSRIASGETLRAHDLQETINALAEAPCGQGYGRFVLGHLAYAAGEWNAAKRYLDAFIKRTHASRPALGIALEGEVRMALATLQKISAN